MVPAIDGLLRRRMDSVSKMNSGPEREFSPQRGLNMSARGRATRREPQSAALGIHRQMNPKAL